MSYLVTFNVKDSITDSHLSNVIFNAGDGSLSMLKDSPFAYNYTGNESYYGLFGRSGYLCQNNNFDSSSLANSTFAAKFYDTINGTWGGGNLTATPTGGASISNNMLDLSYGDIRYLQFLATNNFNFAQVGAVKEIYIPNYSGAPTSTQILFSNAQTVSTFNNYMELKHEISAGNLRLSIFSEFGIPIINNVNLGFWSPTALTEYELELNVDITTGATRLFIDGTQFGSTITNTGTRSSIYATFYIGQSVYSTIYQTNCFVKDFVVYNTVQHTSNYIPGYTIPNSTINILMPQVISADNIGLVWDQLISSHVTSGSTGEALNLIRASSLYDNIFIDQPVYSSNNILTSCRVRIYSNAGSVGTDSDVLYTYNMTATELAGNVLTYKTVKV